MPRRSELARIRFLARPRLRAPGRSVPPLALTTITLSLVLGCQANYKARNLPLALQAPPAPTSSNINLEQMSGAGVGTAQIGPGDLVQITIVTGSSDERVTPIPARVAYDGMVMVPLIGDVHVSGLEPVAAEARIAAAAVERGIYRQPHVTLTVTQPAVNKVTVLGAVAKPGVVELPRGSCDLASAVAAAGGLSKDAGTQIEVMHRGQASFMAGGDPKQGIAQNGVVLAAYNEPLSSRPPQDEVTRIDLAQVSGSPVDIRKLDDRDVVMVLPAEKRVIHVTGLVKTPDQFELPRDKDIRVLDAIAMAGGTTSPVADKIFVIRQLPNMTEPTVIKVSMYSAKHDGNENIRLAAGDLVSVESTAVTMAVETVGKFFRVALGLNGSVSAF
jgi:polysaccharide export outer membrane protein